MQIRSPHRVSTFLPVVVLLGVLGLLGCQGAGPSKVVDVPKIRSLNLIDPVQPEVSDNPIILASAKNEYVCFTLQLDPLPATVGRWSLRFVTLRKTTSPATIDPSHFSVYQIVSMPVDLNRAGYVRHTGLSVKPRDLPRALLPMTVEDGRMPLSALRHPSHPRDRQTGAIGSGQPIKLWVDLLVPAQTPEGEYEGAIELIDDSTQQVLARAELRTTVHDFVLPDERHLMMVGSIAWEDLLRLWPERFEAVTPRLLTRRDDRYKEAVRTLDELVTLAQAHRAQVVFPRLQPTVKWPAGRPPQVYWEDYDSVVSPWLNGTLFRDRTPLGYWPLPEVDFLNNYPSESRAQYWSEVASHFDQLDWLVRSAVQIEAPRRGRLSTLEAVRLSAEAAAVLNAHPRIRVRVPLEDDQIQFAGEQTPGLIRRDSADRLITANPGLVFSTPLRTWPAGVVRPERWVRTDMAGLIPYVGTGGDERDVRVWAWLSFLPLPPPPMGVQYGQVRHIQWTQVLPSASRPDTPADPNELIWFYPGSWFGFDQPIPTVQLKWIRRAQQDYEYLNLARQRGEIINALFMARLMTKPVQLQPAQSPDPTFGLMSGTSDPQAWTQAMDLLARRILLREPGAAVDRNRDIELSLQTLRWGEPQERPVIMGRTTQWLLEPTDDPRLPHVSLRLGIDIYNASDSTPDQNTLQWTAMPAGWIVEPRPTTIEALATYQVHRFSMDARIDPSRVNDVDRTAAEITFTNGFTKRTSQLRMHLPVANSDRREARLLIDGLLDDWTVDDAIHDGPLVRMYDRPSLQAQKLVPASEGSRIYTAWHDENFYLAFKVTGLEPPQGMRTVRNFVNYQFRRAWGEDLVQILIQPVYADGSVGPVLHVVCKTNGDWIERKMDPRLFADPWQPLEGAGVRYVATIDGSDWRGELAIPWKAINAPDKPRPVMLRFNFSQHNAATGESASWAGPVDFGRDDAFTGVLFLRETETPGMIGR